MFGSKIGSDICCRPTFCALDRVLCRLLENRFQFRPKYGFRIGQKLIPLCHPFRPLFSRSLPLPIDPRGRRPDDGIAPRSRTPNFVKQMSCMTVSLLSHVGAFQSPAGSSHTSCGGMGVGRCVFKALSLLTGTPVMSIPAPARPPHAPAVAPSHW